jgi:hypothetical protein
MNRGHFWAVFPPKNNDKLTQKLFQSFFASAIFPTILYNESKHKANKTLQVQTERAKKWSNLSTPKNPP